MHNYKIYFTATGDSFYTRKNSDDNKKDFIDTMDEAFLLAIRRILDPIVNNCDQLSYNGTTNQAER